MRYILIVLLLTGCAQTSVCSPPRDKRGRIVRDHAAVREFKRTHVCPGTGNVEEFCFGYVVDHVVPLCACGPDRPDNMQYQSIKEAREKDKTERRTCHFVSR